MKKAQLLQKNQRNMRRYQDSLELMIDCRQQADNMLSVIKGYLDEIQIELDKLPTREDSSGNKTGDDDDAASAGLDGSEDGNFPKTKAGEELRTRNQALQSRLRECQVQRHKIFFLMGDIYNVLGNIVEEQTAYASADDLRKSLLSGNANN